tara:strand:+ start:719 stop:1018 length:300 start_codon:yes stop_codon:yes gene_type:complete
MMIFLLCCHISTCIWIITAAIVDHENYIGTWMESYANDYGDSNSAIYLISTYWTITTITTVGYGDISGTNLAEMAISVVMMLVGVISFSFANASLASII